MTCLIYTGGSSNIYSRFFGVKRSHYFTCIAKYCRKGVEFFQSRCCSPLDVMFIKTCFFMHAMRLFVPLTVDRSGQHCSASLAPTRASTASVVCAVPLYHGRAVTTQIPQAGLDMESNPVGQPWCPGICISIGSPLSRFRVRSSGSC